MSVQKSLQISVFVPFFRIKHEKRIIIPLIRQNKKLPASKMFSHRKLDFLKMADQLQLNDLVHRSPVNQL